LSHLFKIASIDVVGRPPRQELLVDEGQFIASHILKRQLLPDAEGSPIHEEHVSSLVILDAEVIAPREQLLFHDVTHGSSPSRISLNAARAGNNGVVSVPQ
jgi:hypothetical protein